MSRIPIDSILELPAGERVEIVQAIWDSVATHPEAVPLADWQREELEQRWKDFQSDPDAGEAWESLRRSLRSE